jgi:hypothetical protein
MRKISRENTLVRKFSLVSDFHRNQNKYKHLIGFTQDTSIWLASLFPFRNGVETNSTIPGEEKHLKIMLRMRSTFSREIFRISLVVELGLYRSILYEISQRSVLPLTDLSGTNQN